MIELEGPVGTKRRGFHFKTVFPNFYIRGRDSTAILDLNSSGAQVASNEFLSNFASVCVPQFAVAGEWGVEPNVFR